MAAGLKGLFEPRSLILVGASELRKADERYVSYFNRLFKNLSRFKGKFQTVDLSGKLPGVEKDFKKIKGVDLAVVALPKDLLTKNLQRILSKTKGLLLTSDDVEPKQLSRLSEFHKKKRLLLLGPASFGVLNPEVGLEATVMGDFVKGNVGIISQSRDVTCAIVGRIRELGLGVSKMACTGDGAGVDAPDLLEYLANDGGTAVICVYVEGLRDGRRFIEAVGTAAVEKPVLILKGGRVRKIFKCAVVQARGILVRSLEEMLAGANVLSKQPPMPGKRVAILTNLKGLGAIALRYLEEYGLVPARPTEEVSKRFAKKIPSARIGEFVDLGISAEADRYKFAVEQLISDENVDGMMIICGVEIGRMSADELLKVMERGKKDKPIVGVVLLTERRRDVLDALARAKTPIYREVESAAAALKISNSRHEILLGLKKVSKG